MEEVKSRFDEQQAKYLASNVEEHAAVVERFGRYPHRNAALGRESTPEEQAWLDDVDNLPGWAKSQLASSKDSEKAEPSN